MKVSRTMIVTLVKKLWTKVCLEATFEDCSWNGQKYDSCEESFGRKSNLKQHVKTDHQSDKSIKCDLRGKKNLEERVTCTNIWKVFIKIGHWLWSHIKLVNFSWNQTKCKLGKCNLTKSILQQQSRTIILAYFRWNQMSINIFTKKSSLQMSHCSEETFSRKK